MREEERECMSIDVEDEKHFYYIVLCMRVREERCTEELGGDRSRRSRELGGYMDITHINRSRVEKGRKEDKRYNIRLYEESL